jgi:hypothetical protein
VTTTTAIASTQNYFGSLVTNSDTSGGSSFTDNLIGNYSCSINTISTTDPNASSRQHCLFGDLSELFAMHADSNALFDYLNLVMMGGSLSATNKANLATALNTAFPTTAIPVLAGSPPTAAQITTYNNALSTWQIRKRDRIKAALWLTVHTPEFQIQR